MIGQCNASFLDSIIFALAVHKLELVVGKESSGDSSDNFTEAKIDVVHICWDVAEKRFYPNYYSY